MSVLKKIKLKNVLGYIYIFLLAVLMAFMYQLFVVKNNFAPAGLNGIATMVQYKTGFSIGYMSLLINTPLCIWAYFNVDKRFARRSFFFSLVYSLVYLYLQKTNLTAFQYDAGGHDTIFPVILSGVIGGIVYCYLSTVIGNSIISGTKRAYKFTIITTHPDEIIQEIFEVIKHGATKVSVEDSYSKEGRTMLLCVINRHQLNDLKEILFKYDNTFAYSESVNETYGNFKRITAKKLDSKA